MATKSAGRGFLRNALDAIVEARTAQAERYVREHLRRNPTGRFYL